MIPKIIHYCWLSNDPYPEEFIKYMNTWKNKLPEYEFVLWNFDKFDKSSSKWVEQAFESRKYAFAADFIRLYAVYNYGGIYMDMDIEVLKSFNDFLESDIMIAYENEDKTGIEAGCFGASKGNPIIKECLDYYKDRQFIKDDGTFDILTLPKILMKTISKYPELSIMDCYTFTCKSYKTGAVNVKPYSYAIHNFAGSWTSKKQQKYDRKRQLYIQKFGSKLGQILAYPYFLGWQISDNGLCVVIKKGIRKIFNI